MSDLEQMGRDIDAVKGYLYEFGRVHGKRPSESLKRMIRDAFLAGCKHARKGGSDSVSDLLERLRRGGK